MHRSKQATILAHIIGWLMFYTMVLLFVTGSGSKAISWEALSNDAIILLIETAL